jgi:hypothetical protein
MKEDWFSMLEVINNLNQRTTITTMDRWSGNQCFPKKTPKNLEVKQTPR